MIPLNQFNTPLKFGALAYPGIFQTPPHIVQFNKIALRLLWTNSLNRLIVSVPVRHGKSFFFSTLLPAWYIILNPSCKILLCSNTLDRATEFCSEVRNLVSNFGEMNSVSLNPRWRSRDKFKTLQGGGVQAFGTGASIAGLGYDLAIVDDPIKNQEEANSPTARDKLNLWMSSELLTRQLPGAKTIVVGSRRHPDDLTARLLALNTEIESPSAQWHEILFRAIGENGQALWEDRYPIAKLMQIRAELELQGQGHVFESLYQNNPINSGSVEWGDNLVNDSLLDKNPNMIGTKIISVDLAVSKRDNADNTAILVTNFDAEGKCTIIDGIVGKLDMKLAEDSLFNLIQLHKPQGVLIESNGWQEMILNNIMERCGETTNIYGYKAMSDKVERIRSLLTPVLHLNKLRIKSCQMGRMILDEARNFPNGAHDDCLDALAYGIGLYNMISGKTDQIIPKVHYY